MGTMSTILYIFHMKTLKPRELEILVQDCVVSVRAEAQKLSIWINLFPTYWRSTSVSYHCNRWTWKIAVT